MRKNDIQDKLYGFGPTVVPRRAIQIKTIGRHVGGGGARIEETSHSIGLGEYAGWPQPERFMGDVQGSYQEFRGELTRSRAVSSDKRFS